MGWTFTHKPKTKSVLDFFKEEFNTPNKFEVLDGAVAELKEAYFAVRRTLPDGTSHVFAMICLLEYRNKDRFNFGYKDMSEFMHPYSYKCPERIFKMLTDIPDQSEDSKNWRRITAEHIAERKSCIKLHDGAVIKLKEPVRFRSGETSDIFICANAKTRIFKRTSRLNAYKLAKKHLLGAVDISKGAFRISADAKIESIIPTDQKAFTLDELQKMVGGMIQVVDLPKQGMHMVCNEEGKLNALPVNSMATRLWEVDYGTTDMIVGDTLFIPMNSGMYA